MRRGNVIAAIVLTILIWGFAFIPLKLLINPSYTDHPLSPESFLFLRFVPLLPLLLLLMARHARKEAPRTLRRDWPWMAAMGLLVIPGYHFPLNLALRTPLHTGLISLILNLSPALTYFLAVALRQERARRARTAGVVLAFAGLAVIFAQEVFHDLRGRQASEVFSWEGAGFMLTSSLAWTFYTLIGRRLARDHDPQFVFAISGAIGTLAVLAAAPILLPPGTFSRYAALGARDWAAWAYVSLLSSFFAYWAWLVALRHYEASSLSSMGNVVPLLVHASAVVFLPEERKAFTTLYVIGALATLFGTTLVVRRPAGGAAGTAEPLSQGASSEAAGLSEPARR